MPKRPICDTPSLSQFWLSLTFERCRIDNFLQNELWSTIWYPNFAVPATVNRSKGQNSTLLRLGHSSVFGSIVCRHLMIVLLNVCWENIQVNNLEMLFRITDTEATDHHYQTLKSTTGAPLLFADVIMKRFKEMCRSDPSIMAIKNDLLVLVWRHFVRGQICCHLVCCLNRTEKFLNTVYENSLVCNCFCHRITDGNIASCTVYVEEKWK
jgi:hypothetical protein